MILELETQVLDNDKIIYSEKRKADSFTKNYGLLIYAMNSGDPQSLTDTSGTVRIVDRTYDHPTHCNAYSNTPSYPFFDAVAPVDDESRGIWVGSGTAPPTKDDYTLTSRITNSNLRYQEEQFSYLIQSNLGKYSISRIFTNMTASDIIVNEVGLVVIYTTWYFLVSHDLISSATISPDQSLNVIYRFKFAW